MEKYKHGRCNTEHCEKPATRHVTARRGQQSIGFYCLPHAGLAVEGWNASRENQYGALAVHNGIGTGRRPRRS